MSSSLVTVIAIIIFAFIVLRFLLFFATSEAPSKKKVVTVQEAIARANELYNANMFAELERYLRIELGKRPKNVPLRKILVNMLIKCDKVPHAIHQLEGLKRLAPDDLEVKSKLAECYNSLRRYKQAIILAEDLHRTEPRNAHFARFLADLYYATKQMRVALDAYQTYADLEDDKTRLLEIQPILGMLYYETNDYENALTAFDALQEEAPDDIDMLNKRMELSQKLQKWDKCLEITKKIVSIRGENVHLLEKIAQMYFNLSDWENALEYYKKLAKVEPKENSNYLHYQNRIAEILINKGENAEAVKLLARLINEHPNDIPLVFTLAHAHVSLNNFEEAVMLYENLIHALPPDQLKIIKQHISNIVVKWADTLFEQGDFTKAFDKYVHAMKYDDENPDVYYKFGASNLKIKNFTDAITNFKRAITLSPDNPKFHYALGCANDEMGNVKTAQTSFEDALQLDRENIKYMGALATTLAKQFTNIEEGIRLFQKVIEKNPQDPDALYNLALAYDIFENKDEAVKYYKMALEVMPTHVEARHNLSILLGYEFSPSVTLVK